jgi:hypothetical protein
LRRSGIARTVVSSCSPPDHREWFAPVRLLLRDCRSLVACEQEPLALPLLSAHPVRMANNRLVALPALPAHLAHSCLFTHTLVRRSFLVHTSSTLCLVLNRSRLLVVGRRSLCSRLLGDIIFCVNESVIGLKIYGKGKTRINTLQRRLLQPQTSDPPRFPMNAGSPPATLPRAD